MIKTAVFDTNPYDRDPLQRASASAAIDLHGIARTMVANLQALANGHPHVDGSVLT